MKKSPMRQVGDIFRPKGAKDSKKEPIALNDELYPVEDAEATLISKLEDRGNKARHTSDGFRPAVEGERVPLGIATLGRAFEDDVENSGNSQVNPNQKLHLHDTARRVLMAQKAASFRHLLSGAHSIASSGHRRAQTLLSSIEEVGVIVKDQNIASDLTSDTFGLRSEGVSLKGFDALVESAQEEENPGVVFPNSEDQLSVGEGLPLLNLGRDNSLPHGYSAIHQRRQQARTSKIKHKWRTSMAHLNPNILAGRIWYLLSHSFLMLAFPLFATAWVLFYYFTNPSLEFLPGNASLSWWCNFIGKFYCLLLVKSMYLSSFHNILCSTWLAVYYFLYRPPTLVA